MAFLPTPQFPSLPGGLVMGIFAQRIVVRSGMKTERIYIKVTWGSTEGHASSTDYY